jgi:hypothetical protein
MTTSIFYKNAIEHFQGKQEQATTILVHFPVKKNDRLFSTIKTTDNI